MCNSQFAEGAQCVDYSSLAFYRGAYVQYGDTDGENQRQEHGLLQVQEDCDRWQS